MARNALIGARNNLVQARRSLEVTRNPLSLIFNPRNPVFKTWGDSITAGSGASDSAHRYVNLVAAARGWTLTNQGVGSTQILDQLATMLTHKSIALTDRHTLHTGYNDMRSNGLDATKLNYYQQALYSAIAWLALTAGQKKYAQQSGVGNIETGSWANSSLYSSTARESTANGATFTTTAAGRTVYICLGSIQSGTGQFNITIDGVDMGTFNCNGSYTTVLGAAAHGALYRFTNLTNTTHTIVLRVIGTGRAIIVYTAGTANTGAQLSPAIWVGNCLLLNTAGLLVPPTNGSAAATAAFNVKIAEVVANLAADGLNVKYVDVCSVFDPTSGIMTADNVHPNNAGHAVIANAFIAGMTSQTHRRNIV